MKSTIALLLVGVASAQNCAPIYSQCGGQGWTGATCCSAGLDCVTQGTNIYYAQCLTTTAQSMTTTTRNLVTTTTTTSATSISTSTSTKVQYAGASIAGFDFGCDNCGNCVSGNEVPPANGQGQMLHFVSDDGMNAFRLPVSWQYLVNWDLNDNVLSSSTFPAYDSLMQSCLSSGAALCIIDMHNYARINGGIIGQSGPSAAAFASIWSQLAAKYAGESKVVFELMNEPHDGSCPGSSDDTLDVPTWAATLQGAVNAIRNAGATSQLILLSGDGWSHTAGYIGSTGDLSNILGITDPSGGTDKLIVDVHEYLDTGDTGQNGNMYDCATNNIGTDDGRGGLANFVSAMRGQNRKAFLTETGGMSSSNCVTYLCQELSYLNSNSDIFLGWIGWAAGSFATNDPNDVVITPTQNSDGSWTDTLLVQQCYAPCFSAGC